MKISRVMILCLVLVGCGSNELDVELMNAVKAENTVQVEGLLARGADVNYTDRRGNSAIIHAVRSRQAEIVKLLMENGAEIQKKNKNNETALTIAAAVDTDLHALMTEHLHREAFRRAKEKNGIRDYSAFIRTYPESKFVDSAIDAIRGILLKKFPEDQYFNSISKGKFKPKLVEALTKKHPFVVAFAPRLVEGHMHWKWTTHFQEIAGKGVVFKYMGPTIVVPGKASYTYNKNSNGLKHHIKMGEYMVIQIIT